jgi:elongation factor G
VVLVVSIPIGNIIGGVNQRRGTIIDTEVRDDEFTLIAEVSLSDMFGYSSALRGATQGKGEFSMEYKVRLVVLYTPILSVA